jgi:molybdopterin molybdotransferase
VLQDSADEIASTISQTLESSAADVLITSGGVSVGKFDHIRKALDLIGAEIIFHGLAIRPGHPALFALLNSSRGKVAFFGLPGNPGAAAACFRFLVIPYLRSSMGQEAEQPIPATLVNPNSTNGSGHLSNGNKPRMDCPGRDVFRPGILHMTEGGENIC